MDAATPGRLSLTSPPAAQALIDHYFDNGTRRADVVRPPSRARLISLVLAQRGSAPGADGVPYEVLAQGAMYVAALLESAFLAAADSPDRLRATLGAAIDLLVWIPKAEGSLLVSAQRPLQLPSCLRRLFGAALAAVAGPVVEPLMPPHQAAKRGGSCGPNGPPT